MRGLVDDDRLVVSQTQRLRQRLQYETETIFRHLELFGRGITANVEADAALAYSRLHSTYKRTMADVAEIVAGVQLLGHGPQYVEIVGPGFQARDHAIDAVVVVEEFDGRVGEGQFPLVHDLLVLLARAEFVAFDLPETAEQVVILRVAMQPGLEVRTGHLAARWTVIWTLRRSRHIHVNGEDVLGSISPRPILDGNVDG